MQFGCAQAARIRAWIAPAAAMMLIAMAQGAAAQGVLPPGFVYLRDMRYAGSDNFVGRPLPGYGAAECVLRREVAAALQRVQIALRAGGLSLKVYDCYRPMRAVRAMVQWVNDGRTEAPTKRFFPKLRKGSLLSGYIASQSRHSTGNTIDLTLTKVDTAPAAPFDPAATYGPCTAPAARRSPDNSVDMGTSFDCFDSASHTTSSVVTVEQRRWRNVLVEAMRKQGFANYDREWWHFSYGRSSSQGAYDFPIRAR
jgi:zinc D-Ala-D-Ala dipeptidase